MTIASAVIIQGFRENNLIPVGKKPSDDELAEALVLLNNFIASIYGYELGENYVDWLVPNLQRTAPRASTFPQGPLGGPGLVEGIAGNNVWPFPPTNSRLVWGDKTVKVYFPDQPDDGARMALVGGTGAGDGGAPATQITLDGNGKFIEGAAAVTITAPLLAPLEWMYRADLATWQRITDIASTDEMPFPRMFDDFFICALSLRQAPRYSKTPASSTVKTADDTLKRLKARYRQSQTTTYGSENFPKTDQSFNNGRWWC
jgi:hypothetical protein